MSDLYSSGLTGAGVKAALAKADTAVQPAALGTAAAQNVGAFATAAQGGKADSAVQPDTPVRLGSAANFTNIGADGTLTLGGAATYWDDLIGGIAGAVRTGPTGVVLNTAEHALEFAGACDFSDYAWLTFQLEHRWKAGSRIFPHIHWEQEQSAIPNWVVQYRWQRQGRAKTGWLNYKCNTTAFTWQSDILNQICFGVGIPAPTDYGMSDLIQVRLVRDTANVSNLFAGAEATTPMVRVSAFDIHIECDALGSASEYTK